MYMDNYTYTIIILNLSLDISESLDAADQLVHGDREKLTKDDDVHSSGEESFHSAHELPPFSCPYCGKCSLEQFFSKDGCPKKKNSSDSKVLFPYLNFFNLDEDEKSKLERRLIEDTKEIIKQFSIFTKNICESLQNCQESLKKIQHSVLSLEAFSEDIAVKVLDKKDREEIKSAQSIYDIFITLTDYTSFFNYEIIEHIIKSHGSADDHKELEEYVSAFNAFCKRSVFEVPANVFSASKGRNTAKMLALKCTEHMYSLDGVQNMIWKIAEAFGLKPLSLQLHSIKKGCIELHFLISADVASRIFPVSPAHESALSDIGVRVLFCEEVEQEESRYIVVYHIAPYQLLCTI